ncbi:MAG: GspH/FimT family pseudopilin [Gammaproteobacteria bacterium]|nr:GspH/FimT family pseudopilin [Gammaproteobacteria bacterium]MDH5652917.1 GspH/FimT family pseudopilin [Gammaproteobacteria bacterium]
MYSRNGFTLIELLTVIMILSLVLTLAGPAYKGGRKDDINVVARKLAADMRYARSLAISKGKKQPIEFDFNGRHYRVADRTEKITLPGDIDLSLTLDMADITVQQGRIIFYPDGSSSGGIVAMSKGNTVMTVTAGWFNGKIQLARK